MVCQTAACEATSSGMPMRSSSICRSGWMLAIAQSRAPARSVAYESVTGAANSTTGAASARRSSTQSLPLTASITRAMISLGDRVVSGVKSALASSVSSPLPSATRRRPSAASTRFSST